MSEQLKQKSAIKEDWSNREFIDKISLSVAKMSDFLNAFGTKLLW
jgi:hypothetical protein